MRDVLSSAPTRARRVDTSTRARSARPADRRVLGPFSTPAETVARWRRAGRRVRVTGARGRPPAKGSVGLRAGSKYAHVSLKPVAGVGIPRDRREDARTAFRSILVSALIVLLLLLFLKMPLHVLLDEAFRAPGELVTLVSTAVTAARTDPAATPSAAAAGLPAGTAAVAATPAGAHADAGTDRCADPAADRRTDACADSEPNACADPEPNACADRDAGADTHTDPGADTHTDPGAYGPARESWLRVRDRWLDAGSARKPRCESGGCALRKWCTEARRHGRVATDR